MFDSCLFVNSSSSSSSRSDVETFRGFCCFVTFLKLIVSDVPSFSHLCSTQCTYALPVACSALSLSLSLPSLSFHSCFLSMCFLFLFFPYFIADHYQLFFRCSLFGKFNFYSSLNLCSLIPKKPTSIFAHSVPLSYPQKCPFSLTLSLALTFSLSLESR